MTPSARIAAAIDCLDHILSGDPAEKTLTTWARSNRYAGSKDRAAVRDHVFDALRCRRSWAELGGAETGRGLMLGGLREQEADLNSLFDGQGYGPDPLSNQERSKGRAWSDLRAPERTDTPDWLYARLSATYGTETDAILAEMRQRAPLYLRVNLRRSTREDIQKQLLAEGIGTVLHPSVPTALEVTSNPRRVQLSPLYLNGKIELQDAASQRSILGLRITPGAKIVDYCAGGGGKVLAIAAAHDGDYYAHDVEPRRMKDLPARAKRAGVSIRLLGATDCIKTAPFDVVFCDVPCSGSGAWRRTPDGKWRLTQSRLDDLCALQRDVLTSAAPLVGPSGMLAYATCSLLAEENHSQVTWFSQSFPEFQIQSNQQFTPLDGGDGFYIAILKRA